MIQTVSFNTPAGKIEAVLVRRYTSRVNVVDSEGKVTTVQAAGGKGRANVTVEVDVCDLVVIAASVKPDQVEALGFTNEQKREGLQRHPAVLVGDKLWQATIKS